MPGSRHASVRKSAAKPVRPRRDFEALKKRRLRAADMFRRGKSQAEVAHALDVSAQSVSQWFRLWSNGGRAALLGAGRAGRLPRLSDEQLDDVVTALKLGPRDNGFPTDLWTLARVADVIEAVTGVRYSQTQTWTILRERLGWSRQRPARRALERNDEAIANWVEVDWPRIKKAPGAGAPGSSGRTSRGSASSPR
jgi:transposase